MDFRTKIKREIISYAMKIETDTKDENLEKNELNLRLLKFFEYEQDPEFERLFNEFCYKKRLKLKVEKEREDR